MYDKIKYKYDSQSSISLIIAFQCCLSNSLSFLYGIKVYFPLLRNDFCLRTFSRRFNIIYFIITVSELQDLLQYRNTIAFITLTMDIP